MYVGVLSSLYQIYGVYIFSFDYIQVLYDDAIFSKDFIFSYSTCVFCFVFRESRYHSLFARPINAIFKYEVYMCVSTTPINNSPRRRQAQRPLSKIPIHGIFRNQIAGYLRFMRPKRAAHSCQYTYWRLRFVCTYPYG